MEKQNEQDAGRQQPAQQEQNPTLHQPGTQVADYGNVMGGSSDENVTQDKDHSNKERSGAGNNETAGTP